MSILVEQQNDTINVIETQAEGVMKDTEAGYVPFILILVCRRLITVAA